MALSINKEANERSLRKTVYMARSGGQLPVMNVIDALKTSTRNEMPNKFLKMEAPKVEIE